MSHAATDVCDPATVNVQVSIKQIDGAMNVWNEYAKFQALPGANLSIVLLEVYSLIKARSIPIEEQGAFPHRDINYNSVVIPWYTDKSRDAKAEAFGNYVSDIPNACICQQQA